MSIKHRITAAAGIAMISLAILGATSLTAPPAQAGVQVGISVGPPPPRYEAVPAYPRAYRPGRVVWRPGFWRWDGRGYVWEPGRYVEIPRHHHYRRWETGRWEHRPGGWVWVDGRWR